MMSTEFQADITDVCCHFVPPPLVLFADLQPGQEDDEQMQRPEVRDEDLAEAKNKLGASTAAKSKTFEVMEECGEDTHTHGNTRFSTNSNETKRRQSFVFWIWLG